MTQAPQQQPMGGNAPAGGGDRQSDAKKEHEAVYGSKLAQAFGYVTPEDRQGWDIQRKKGPNKVQGGLNKGAQQALRMSQMSLQARTHAAAMVDAQKESSQFDQQAGHDHVADYEPMDFGR